MFPYSKPLRLESDPVRSTWIVVMVNWGTTNPEFAFSATPPPPTAASKLKHKSKEGRLVVIQRGFQAEPILLGRSSQRQCGEKKRVGLILGFLAAGAWIRGQRWGREEMNPGCQFYL